MSVSLGQIQERSDSQNLATARSKLAAEENVGSGVN